MSVSISLVDGDKISLLLPYKQLTSCARRNASLQLAAETTQCSDRNFVCRWPIDENSEELYKGLLSIRSMRRRTLEPIRPDLIVTDWSCIDEFRVVNASCHCIRLVSVVTLAKLYSYSLERNKMRRCDQQS